MDKIKKRWIEAHTMVCVGLDTDLTKIPSHLKDQKNPLFEFNRQIVDATHDLVCAYKPQIAYYAAQDAEGELRMTLDYIKKTYPEIPIILDSKRGDIGDTAEMYAREAFEVYKADAVTVNPYMGGDTLQPFLKRSDKGIIILCKTSNPGSAEFQNRVLGEGKKVFEVVAEKACGEWNTHGNVCLVVGGTHLEELADLRRICPQLPFLVPGVGAQGGDVVEIVRRGRDANGFGLVINSSRGIIYASSGKDFAVKAREATLLLRDQIKNA